MPPARRCTRRRGPTSKNKTCAVLFVVNGKDITHRLGSKVNKIRTDACRVLERPGRVCNRCHASAVRRFSSSGKFVYSGVICKDALDGTACETINTSGNIESYVPDQISCSEERETVPDSHIEDDDVNFRDHMVQALPDNSAMENPEAPSDGHNLIDAPRSARDEASEDVARSAVRESMTTTPTNCNELGSRRNAATDSGGSRNVDVCIGDAIETSNGPIRDFPTQQYLSHRVCDVGVVDTMMPYSFNDQIDVAGPSNIPAGNEEEGRSIVQPVRRILFSENAESFHANERRMASEVEPEPEARLSLKETLFYPIAVKTSGTVPPPPSSIGLRSSLPNEVFAKDRALLTGLSERDAQCLAGSPGEGTLSSFRQNDRARRIRHSLVERAQRLVPRRLEATMQVSPDPDESVGTVLRNFSYHNYLPKHWVGSPKTEWNLDGLVWATKEKERVLRQNPGTPVRTRGVAAKVCWDGNQPVRIYLGEDKQPMPYPEENYRIYAAFRTAFISSVCKRFGLEQYSRTWSEATRRDGRMLDVGEMIQGLTEQGMRASDLDDIVYNVSSEVNRLHVHVFQECTNLNKVFYRLDCVEKGLCTKMQTLLFGIMGEVNEKECLLFAPRSRKDGRAMNLHTALIEPSFSSCIDDYNDRTM